MCGFNGVIGNLTEGKINEVKSNSSLIQHRGPDEHTNLYKKDTYIEFYRLSIVDIENGSQPQTDKDDNYTVFFNIWCELNIFQKILFVVFDRVYFI